MRILYLPNVYSQQRQREKKVNVYPVLMAMEAELYRQNGHDVTWIYDNKYHSGSTVRIIDKAEGLPFLDLPSPNRIWTDAINPMYQNNGNFKYLPGTYIQSARDCWWAKCTFCKWAKKYPNYEVRPIKTMITEIEECAKLGFREVFDDSGTFPFGDWLIQFCYAMIDSGLNKKVKLGCNMRLINIDYELMAKAGFRMVLFGVESANQETLDRINKGVRIKDAEKIIKKAARAGLDPHVAVMVGYPWETDKDARNTIRFVHGLLKRGYAKTAQCSLYDVPGVKTDDRYRTYTKSIYQVGYSPIFWYNKIKSIRTKEDITYILRGIKEGVHSLSSA